MTYFELKKLKKEYKYNRYFILTLIVLMFGSPIIGIAALYNLHNFNECLCFYDKDDSDLLRCINKKRKIIKILIDIGIFFVVLHLFFLFIFILGSIVMLNEMNSYVIFG